MLVEDKMRIDHNEGEEDGARTLHAVIIPLPAQGHITPCLQLAKKLVVLGFRITFVNTTQNHERLMKARSENLEYDKDIEFISVSDGMPDDHPRLRDVCAFLKGLLKLGPVFEELFVKLQRESPITCVVRDFRFSTAHGVAKKLGIPVVAFVTPSAICAQSFYHLPAFLSTGVLPLPPPPAHVAKPSFDVVAMTIGLAQSDEEVAARQVALTCLPGASPTMRVEDLPTTLLTHDRDSFWYRLYQNENPLLPECECILFNTFHDLDGDLLDAMSAMNSNILAVGPLVLNSMTAADGVEEVVMVGVGSALWEEDRTSLSWLNDRSPNSVLFVSFGSIVLLSAEQMQEFADGLEMSGHAFLWVIRSDFIQDLCKDKQFESMFLEFVVRTRERALVVPWVPQTAVLLHPSVAAFLTHCGWNSTIESISSGVPMLGRPQFADQIANSHYIAHVWRIGLQFQTQPGKDGSAVVSREEVARKVRKIMAPEGTDQEVDAIRSNSKHLQMAAKKAMGEGGSSQRALATFVELIKKKSKQSPQQLS